MVFPFHYKCKLKKQFPFKGTAIKKTNEQVARVICAIYRD